MSIDPPSPSAPDVAQIARAVLRLARRLRAEGAPAAPPGRRVALSAFGMLATLHREGPMPAARLAEAERLEPQSLSRILRRLEADGLIERTPGTTDRRTLILSVTPAGRSALRREMTARRAWLERAVATCMTVPERRHLGDAAALMLRLADASIPAAKDRPRSP